jgi:carboxyl-terminal processing protease
LIRPTVLSILSAAALLGGGVFSSLVDAAAPPLVSTDSLRGLAEDLEQKELWSDAGRLYEELLKHDRADARAREGYQRCLRHVLQARRHRDAAFRQAVIDLPSALAADVYREVLEKIRKCYVDGVAVERLYELGLQEFAFALDDDVFVKEHLALVKPEAIDGFRAQFERWRAKKPLTEQEARDQVLDIAFTARRVLGLEPAVAILEFACGACNGLDEYTTYLTPGQLLDARSAARGELAGIGIQVAVIDRKLYISYVYPDSSAFEQRLQPGDQITQIDRRPVDQLSPEEAAARLQGEVGTAVELVVFPLREVMPRTVKVLRGPVIVQSVESDMFFAEDDLRIGLLRVLAFRDRTVREMRDHLMQLQSMGMDVLILDLRGNPGGSFRSAVEATQLFLDEGVIVLTYGRLPGVNRTYRAVNPNPLNLPLVVLVDGDTASSAEVVAGALKENQRATLVGQTTFGKGTLQMTLPLDKVTSGIRITFSRLYSPNDYPYSGHGVIPHIVIVESPEAQLEAAREFALQLTRMMGR